MAEVTELLLRWNSGDEDARASLIDAIYDELRKIAARHLSGERHVVELQPDALVNEAYIRLIDINRIDWQNRAHFFAVAARVMREILVDHARKRRAAKRDGGVQVTLSNLSSDNSDPATDTLLLHEALERLAAADPERAQLVELRFFGGMTIEETAEVMGVSTATVKRNWTVARGWLFHAINEEPGDPV